MFESEKPLYDTLGGRTRAGLRRVSHILAVLGRFGLSYLAHHLDPRYPRRQKPVDEAVARMELPERLRHALEELGPTAIKFGQLLATRGDLLSAPYVQELRQLQDKVPPAPWEEVARVLQQELGAPPEKLFSAFEATPRASASLAQVHYATLPDGAPVAVKVQREHVAEIVELDLNILLAAARQAERNIAWAAENRLLELVQDFAHHLRRELNFLNEAHNTERLRQNLRHEKDAYVPQVYWEYCTRRVLVVEWVPGAKATDEEALTQYGVDRPAAARNMASLMMRQILRDGFFHNDPHPGNVLFMGGARIAFLDCGNAVSVDRQLREHLMALLLAALEEDPQEITDQLLLLGVVSDATDVPQLTADVGRMISYYAGLRSSAQVGLGELLDQMLSLVLRHRVRMPAALAAIAKALMVTEGVCLQLDGEFDAQQVVRQEAGLLLWERLKPQRLARDLSRVLRSYYRYALLLPRQINQVLQRLQGGGVRVRLAHENMEQSLHRLDLMINRLAFAIVVAAIIVSSTNLVMNIQTGGMLGEWLIWGYLLAGIVLGAWLLFSILRSGRL